MKITINSLTPKGKEALQRYFPIKSKLFRIKCKLNKATIEIEEKENLKIIINKNFSNTDKDKTFVVYLIQDLKKLYNIEVLKDYTIEADFNE